MIYIIIPVKNEAKVIKRAMYELDNYCKKKLLKYYIVFINDGSTDNTLSKLFQLKIELKSVRAIFNNRFDRGKGSALKVGFILADAHFKLSKEDIIIFFDSDGQIQPKDIGTALRLIKIFNADAAIGNKRHLYSNITYSLKRRLVSDCYNLFIRIFFGLQLRDTQCGLKVFKKEALDKVIDVVNVKCFAFDLELLIALKDNNFRVVDTPVFIAKQLNAGSVNFSNICQTFIDTLKIWIKRQAGYYKCQQ